MAKVRKTYVCAACGGVSPRWMGKCPDCGTWDSLEELRLTTDAEAARHDPQRGLAAQWSGGGGAALGSPFASAPNALEAPKATAIADIQALEVPRLPTGIAEFDRVLGGGLVPGSSVLVGGEPGIGKSTLLLQAAARIAAQGRPVLYVTSEESAQQVQLRARRLDLTGGNDGTREAGASQRLFVLVDTNLSRIFEQARQVGPAVLIVDSIQMIYNAAIDASPGSITQLRRCCMELVYLAKSSGIAVLLVGHVTKEGQVAGPRLLEHLVDAVLYFEGDRYHAHRIVRAVKNRFGTTLEIGLFEMGEAGLREVVDPAGAIVPGDDPRRGGAARPGSVVTAAMQGSRCFLVELQALTAPGFLGAAKRKVSGLDGNRFAMLLAVLEKHAGMRLSDQDIFASVVGGLRIVEPAADLAIALAVAGMHLGKSMDAGTVAIGEVGLGGEVRRVGQLEHRLREAARLGYRHALVPSDKRIAAKNASGLEIAEVRTIDAAMQSLG